MTVSKQSPDRIGLLSHLLELRTRLIRSLAGVLVVGLGLLPFAQRLYGALARPLLSQLPQGTALIAVYPAAAILAPLKLVAVLSVVLTAPWWLYQLWAFVAPGLYQRERRLAGPILLSAVGLFYGGAWFAYDLVLPNVFRFLELIKPSMVALTPDAAAYLDFVFAIVLAFALCFELPVAMVIAVMLGWLTPQQLQHMRGYAIVAIFILAAIMTPPDVVTQLMLAIPMCILYEAGIWVVRCCSLKQPNQTEA